MNATVTERHHALGAAYTAEVTLRSGIAAACALVLAATLAAPAALAAPDDDPSGVPSVAAATPVTPPDLPVELEPLADYQGQGICSPTPKPGTQALADLIRATYGADQNVWIPRDCGVGGRSEHKEGRAIDWMLDVRDPAEAAMAKSFIRWLLAPDDSGTRYAMARRLGVMYIGWNNRIWESYQSPPGWDDIFNYAVGKPCSQTPEAQYSTAPCHRDHIHLSLSWDAAAKATTFWGGSPTPLAPCTRWSSTDARPRVTVRGLDFVGIEPTRAYDSAAGTATAEPCRLTQATGGGVGAAVYVPVTGLGGVADRPIRAALLRVRAVSPNSPLSVYAWPAGGQRPAHPVLTAQIAQDAAADTIVGVGTDGTIALAVDSGATALTVDVLGYFVLPSSSTPEGDSGPLATVPPSIAYTTRGSVRGPLEPGERRLVRIAGTAGLPAADAEVRMRTAWLTVTTLAGRLNGAVGIAPRRSASPGQTVPVRRLEPATAAVITEVDGRGRIAITNTARAAVHVDVAATAWSARGEAGGGVLRPMAPTPTLDTRSGLGVRDDRVPASNGMRVLGAPGLPKAGVGAVALQVRLEASDQGAVLRLWPSTAAQPVPPTLSAPAGTVRTAFVVLPLGPTGGLRWSVVDRSGALLDSAEVRVSVVGVVTVPEVAEQPDGGTASAAARARSQSGAAGAGTPSLAVPAARLG